MDKEQSIHLGLTGDTIGPSRVPDLHEIAGRLNGFNISYKRLVPRDMGMSFEHVFAQAEQKMQVFLFLAGVSSFSIRGSMHSDF